MRKVIISLIVCASTLEVFAQNNPKEQRSMAVSDSIKSDTIKTDTKSIVSLNDLTLKLEAANATIDKQKERLLKLQDIETKLSIAQNENSHLKKELETVKKQVKSVENNLLVVAANFLFIPYEAYGVEEIALKAFESIEDYSLKQENQQTYLLLKQYQNHLKEFKLYLQRVQKECNGIFQATATEFIDSKDPSINPDLILTKQQFYQDYIKFEGYQNTFIGGLIQKTQEILRAHTKQKRANMHEVIETIEETQSPEEIDSISKVIGLIDERLKTIEDS